MAHITMPEHTISFLSAEDSTSLYEPSLSIANRDSVITKYVQMRMCFIHCCFQSVSIILYRCKRMYSISLANVQVPQLSSLELSLCRSQIDIAKEYALFQSLCTLQTRTPILRDASGRMNTVCLLAHMCARTCCTHPAQDRNKVIAISQ